MAHSKTSKNKNSIAQIDIKVNGTDSQKTVNNRGRKKLTNEVTVPGIKTVKDMGIKKRGRKRLQDDIAAPSPKKVKVDLLVPNTIENGIVLTCGTGDIGQLGLGPDVEEKTRPCALSDVSNVVQVVAGGLHSLCLTKDGKVYSWGCNDEGSLGRITKEEEELFCVGVIDLPEKAVHISAGDCHSAAVLADGRVFAWGSFRDNSGLLGFVEEGNMQKTPRHILKDVCATKVASGNHHLVVLAQNGRVYTCGCGESGQLGRIAEVFASRGSRKGIEILLEPQPLKVFKSRKLVLFEDIWAGGYVTFVKASGSGDIYGFGLNNYYQLGDSDTNMKFQPLLLKSFKGRNWKSFAAGQHHSIALDSTGCTYSLGRNEYGRLGLGAGIDAMIPTAVPALKEKKAVHISAGECVSFAVLENGEAYGFGMGTNNQLAQGNEDDLLEPGLLKGKQLEDKRVLTVESGGQHTIILAVTK